MADSFVTYVGWLYSWGAPLTLIGEDANQIATAQRELARIGVDDVTGAAVGDVRAIAGARWLRSYRVGELPEGSLWVHCASGYRASVAASILDFHDRSVVLIDDDFGKAAELNLTT